MRPFFVASLLILFVLPSSWCQQQKPAHQKKAGSENTKPEPSPAKGCDHPPSTKQADSPDSQSRQWPPPWWSFFWPNWGLVVVGGLAAVAALLTLFAIKDQNEAIGDTAAAARSQAQAVINSERPWMLIRIETRKSGTDEDGIFQHCAFSVSFQNYGKTPAEIVAFENHLDTFRDLSDLPLPPEYTLEGEGMTHTRIIPGGEVWQDQGESAFYAESGLLQSQWQEILKSQLRLVYWGRLQYRDLIEEPKTIHELEKVGTIHQTCFCYFWSPKANEFFVWGRLGYNKHT